MMNSKSRKMVWAFKAVVVLLILNEILFHSILSIEMKSGLDRWASAHADQ